MTPVPAQTDPTQLSLLALFLKFLRFGALAFGGPVAQIAMIRHALVDQERWIDSARFNRLLAVLQILPGPEAHELCVHLGMIARGRIGGLLAGLGFMLPGLLLMLLAGWLYVTWIAGDAGLTGLLLGVQIAVLAIILRAMFRIGQHIIEDRLLAAIAIASLLATLAGVPFWIPLAAGGLAYAAAHRPLIALAVMVAAIGAALAARQLVTPDTDIALVAGAPITLLALFFAGLKGGLLTFGGAYTAIPYVRADTVERGWVDDATFLDGIALAGVLPAPLVIFATFVGYVVGGPAGALAITAGMFLPAFAFSLIFFERLEAVVENPALHRLLAGVAAAVVGVIAATFVQLGEVTAARVSNPLPAILLFAAALAIVWRVKGAWVTPAIIAAAALTGWLLAL
ncbi:MULTISPECIES: chromate efflux transporter [unclassified Sphingopyxis]|jgi:chromate transporter|uniref:chromate efflux transporter n=1 Tax=unclassified Sphingopyxis TaxID=2614943 RepID=UPI0028660F23|nr:MULTISPECIES: chromate efflux transporter [unclassified Sphingopyxis]MDR6834153.1 chromate transporter [Sphingopyxis sp. BE122]MDR7226421.1 chromate transporter [Sphingopyxis sp. BE259]